METKRTLKIEKTLWRGGAPYVKLELNVPKWVSNEEAFQLVELFEKFNDVVMPAADFDHIYSSIPSCYNDEYDDVLIDELIKDAWERAVMIYTDLSGSTQWWLSVEDTAIVKVKEYDLYSLPMVLVAPMRCPCPKAAQVILDPEWDIW